MPSRGTSADILVSALPPHSLAWAEMYLVLATLVQRFDFVFEGATAADFEMERDNFAIGTRAGCNLMARVSIHTG